MAKQFLKVRVKYKIRDKDIVPKHADIIVPLSSVAFIKDKSVVLKKDVFSLLDDAESVTLSGDLSQEEIL